jgi:hypothetical protein
MARNPTIFGPNGGFSRAFSMSDVATTLAMMMGPIIAGSLHETVGYYNMNVIFGENFASFFFLFLSLSLSHTLSLSETTY